MNRKQRKLRYIRCKNAWRQKFGKKNMNRYMLWGYSFGPAWGFAKQGLYPNDDPPGPIVRITNDKFLDCLRSDTQD